MDAKTLRRVSPLVKEYAKTRFVHDYQDRNSNAINARVSIGLSGKAKLDRGAPYVCYGNLNRTVDPDTKAILLQIQPRKEAVTEEAFRHYIHWVINLSPWRHAFISKNIDRVMRDGVVVVDATYKGNTVSGGMIALRQAWENYSANFRHKGVQAWYELLGQTDPVVAFAASCLFSWVNDHAVIPTPTFAGHTPLNQDGSNRLDSFVRGNMVDNSEPWCVGAIHRLASGAWPPATMTPKSFAPFVHKLVEQIDSKKTSANPFAARNETKVYERNRLITFLAENLQPEWDKLNGTA